LLVFDEMNLLLLLIMLLSKML